MKRIGIITLFAALFCFMVTSVAMAYSLLGVAPVAPNTSISFQFYDYEFWVDSNGNHLIDYGDKIYGLYKINGIIIGSTTYGLGNQFLGGNFTYTIISPSTGTLTSNAIIMKDSMNLYYNPYAPIDFNATGWFGTNNITPYVTNAGGSPTATVKLAEFKPTAGYISANLGSITSYCATTGTTTTLDFNNSDTSWVAGAKIASLANVYLTPTNTAFASVLGAVFDPNSWVMNSYMVYPPSNSPPDHWAPTYQTLLTGGNFTFVSSDPITVTFSHPVPEPATIMLLGAGLLGLGSWGRKKTKKDKES